MDKRDCVEEPFDGFTPQEEDGGFIREDSPDPRSDLEDQDDVVEEGVEGDVGVLDVDQRYQDLFEDLEAMREERSLRSSVLTAEDVVDEPDRMLAKVSAEGGCPMPPMRSTLIPPTEGRFALTGANKIFLTEVTDPRRYTARFTLCDEPKHLGQIHHVCEFRAWIHK